MMERSVADKSVISTQIEEIPTSEESKVTENSIQKKKESYQPPKVISFHHKTFSGVPIIIENAFKVIEEITKTNTDKKKPFSLYLTYKSM